MRNWRQIAATLTARYDNAALRVAPPTAIDPARLAWLAADRPAAWITLADWCFDGDAFGVATLTGPDRLALAHLAEAFSRELDGSVLLDAASGALARWRMRLTVKLHDTMAWRERRRADPWDCGYLVDEPAARAALRRFAPRRATLIVASSPAPEHVAEAIAVLRANAARFDRPVRLLVLDVAPGALRLSATSPCAGSR